MRTAGEAGLLAHASSNGDESRVRNLRADECLEEVSRGVGPDWKGKPLYGATRSGIAVAKERVGKNPERYKPVEPGSVFYNPMRILLQSIAMVDEGDPSGITSPDYVVVRGRPGILHHRIFYYWLRSPEGEMFIRQLARGGVRERILFNRLCEGKIPVLPWRTQELLAKQLALIPTIRAASAERLAAAEALLAAYRDKAFTGALSPPSISTVPFGQIIASYRNGFGRRPVRGEKGTIVLRLADVSDGTVSIQQPREVAMTIEEQDCFAVLPGDLLFVRVNGSADFIGRCIEVPDVGRTIAFNDHLIRARLRDGNHPAFVSAYMATRRIRELIIDGASTSAGQLTINQEFISTLPFPRLCLDEQKRIVADLSHRLAEAERIAGRLREEVAAVDALPAALLREAFHATQTTDEHRSLVRHVQEQELG